MSNDIVIVVEDIEAIIAAYQVIDLERAATVDGSYSVITSLTLVEGDYTYTYTDETGQVSDWYRYRYRNTSTSDVSVYSNPWIVAGNTRKQIRQHILQEYRAGAVLLASATGQLVTAIASDDYRIASTYYSSERGKGTWLMPTSGQREGEVTRIGAVNTSAIPAVFTVSPPLSGALNEDDQVEWHWLMSPDDINQCINRACDRIYYLERVPIVGDGENSQILDFLPWLVDRSQVTGLWFTPDGWTHETPFAINGQWHRIHRDGTSLVLTTVPAIAEDETVYLEALRSPDRLYTEDSILASEVSLEYIAAVAYDEMLTYLLRPSAGGASSDKTRWMAERVMHRRGDLARIMRKHRPIVRYQRPQPEAPSAYRPFLRVR